jgi:hypothetical protein
MAQRDPHYRVVLVPTPDRNSMSLLADPRALPFVGDLLDKGCEAAGDSGIVVFTNADIVLCNEACAAVRHALRTRDVAFGHRADSREYLRPGLHRHQVAAWLAASGVDLFAFRPRWWRGVRAKFPDVFLGAEGWDAILRWLMLRTAPLAEMHPAAVYHEMHAARWSMRPREPAQQHNRRVCEEWARANGYADRIIGGRFLFRVEA